MADIAFIVLAIAFLAVSIGYVVHERIAAAESRTRTRSNLC